MDTLRRGVTKRGKPFPLPVIASDDTPLHLWRGAREEENVPAPSDFAAGAHSFDAQILM